MELITNCSTILLYGQKLGGKERMLSVPGHALWLETAVSAAQSAPVCSARSIPHARDARRREMTARNFMFSQPVLPWFFSGSS